MNDRVFRGVGKLYSSEKIQPNAHERLWGLIYFKITLDLKDMIVLMISNFTKLWPLEENVCDGFYIFFVFIISFTKYEKSILKFVVV